jgi:hypothetical protein
MAHFSFDSTTVEPRENNFEVLPAGTYAAQVVESEIVPLKSGNGDALKLTLEILSEGFRGRKVWSRLNVRHTNRQAEQIAQQQLRELTESVGMSRFSDTAELHNKPMQVRLKVRKDDSGQYEPQNEVVGFKPLATAGAPAAPGMSAPKPPAAPAAAPSAPTPPWQKRVA